MVAILENTKIKREHRHEINQIARAIFRGDTEFEAPMFSGTFPNQLPPDELSTRLEQTFLAAVGFSGLAVTYMLAAKRTQNPLERNQGMRTAFEYAQRHEAAQRKHDAIRDEFDARKRERSGRWLDRSDTYIVKLNGASFRFDLILVYSGTGDFLEIANARELETVCKTNLEHAGKPHQPAPARAWIDLARWCHESTNPVGRPRESEDHELIYRDDGESLKLRGKIKTTYPELVTALEVIRLGLAAI